MARLVLTALLLFAYGLHSSFSTSQETDDDAPFYIYKQHHKHSSSPAFSATDEDSPFYIYKQYHKHSSSRASPATVEDTPFYIYKHYHKHSPSPASPATGDDAPFYIYKHYHKHSSSRASPGTVDDTPFYIYKQYHKYSSSPTSRDTDDDAPFYIYKHYNKHSSSPASPDTVDNMSKMKKMAILFREDALRVGQTLTFQFPAATTAPLGFLPRHIAEAIPFSSATFPAILAQLGIPKKSIQAAKMKDTLAMCEAPGLSWEAKFCATSLEVLVEGVQGILGTRAVTEMVSSRVPRTGSPRLQPYAVRTVRTIEGSSFVGCHHLEYPYRVYMCHSTGPSRAYEVDMEGADDGDSKVTVLAVCHTDTSEWDEDHVVFRILGTKPGGAPVCHVLPYGHILWAKKNASLSSA